MSKEVIKFLNKRQRSTIKTWLADLRSGDYKQGAQLLRGLRLAADGTLQGAVEQFCCLGVLCKGRRVKWDREEAVELFEEGDVFPLSYNPVRGSLEDDGGFEPDGMITSVDFEFWTGLHELPEGVGSNGRDLHKRRDFLSALTILNDGGWLNGINPPVAKKHTFKQIAKIIERRANWLHPGWKDLD